MFLIYKGQTTNEHLRAVFRGRTNTDDHGLMGNLDVLCCHPIPDSFIPSQTLLETEDTFLSRLRQMRRTWSASERSALEGVYSEGSRTVDDEEYSIRNSSVSYNNLHHMHGYDGDPDLSRIQESKVSSPGSRVTSRVYSDERSIGMTV